MNSLFSTCYPLSFFETQKTSHDIKKAIPLLQETIQYHREKYYTDEPEITDAIFDEMYALLKKWETQFPETKTENSPTQSVAFLVQSDLKKKSHLVPMISLDNAYSKTDLEEWEQRWKKFSTKEVEYIVEPKFDGLGISCVFKNGIFSYALTRGDGSEGEDVSENAKTFLPNISIPHKEIFEIRGEVVMKKSDFENLNIRLQKEGKKLFSNPRNAAAGSLRQLDASITKERNLSVFFYETPLPQQQKDFQTYQNALSFFENHSIPHPPQYFICKNINEVFEKITFLQSIRESLDYDIDGAVIKINNFEQRNEIGSTNHHPRWAIAYKFPAKQVATKLIHVEWQVGRSGVLTPVAHLEPIEIDGVIIQRATLHNPSYIAEKDICINDTVLLERSGDVIPKIIMPIVAKRNGSEKKIIIPHECPVCHTPTISSESEVSVLCPSIICPAKMQGQLEHFASKKCMNIDGLGTMVAKMLVESQKIKHLADIFLLEKNDLLKLDGFQEKSAEKLYQAIQESKKNPLWRWIHAMGISGVGEKTAKALAENFSETSMLSKLSAEELMQIDDIGEKTAKEISEYFSIAANNDIWKYIETTESKNNSSSDKKLSHHAFVFTGTFQNFSREQAQELAEKSGAKILSAVSKNTTAVVCGENAGSKKIKAQSLNIPIWSEQEFLDNISATPLFVETSEKTISHL